MPRAPRLPRLASLHRRALLALGITLAVGGALGMLVHGPDDTVVISEQVQPDASAGLPTVVHPVSTAFGGAELVVRAEAAGGLFLGAAHRVDATDLIEGIRHIELDSLGLREGSFVEGFPVELQPEPIVGWLERSSGEGVQEVRVDLHGPPVDVLAVPVDPTSAATMSFGVHVDGIFYRALVILVAGLLLIALWVAARRARRRTPVPPEGLSTPEPETVWGSAVVPPLPDSPRWRRPAPQDAEETPPAPPPGSTAVAGPPAKPLVALPPPVIQPIPPAAPTPESPAREAGPTSPTPRSLGSGLVVGAATLALGGGARWWARRKRRGTTFLLLLALLLGGCGFAPTGDQSDQKPGLEPAAVEEMLADYANRRTRAARRANAPRFDGAKWVRAQTGPMLAGSQWQAIADRISETRSRVRRPVLVAEQVHAPLFRDYPMWAAVTIKEEDAGRSLVVFTRRAFAEPWMATASVDVAWGAVPRPDPRPRPVGGEAFDAGAATAELVDTWWEEGDASGLIVDEDTAALRDEIVPLYYPPDVQAWPEVSERRFMVGVQGGDQIMVTVHRMTVGARPYALTTLVLMPTVGRPQVLASSVLRILS